MSNTVDQIQKIIQKAGIDGTLTEEAVGFFNKTIEKLKSLKVELEESKRIYESLNKNFNGKCEQLEKVTAALKAYNDREDELETREKEMLKLELTAQYERERVDDHKEMFNVVFRNIEVRRGVFTPYAATPGDPGMGTQYPAPSGVQQDEERTKTE